MTAVLAIKDDGVYCRGCGSSWARPHENPDGLCASCFARNILMTPVNKYLVRKLELAVGRKRRGRMLGPCECVATASNAINLGYQCSFPASAIVDGHKVCAIHSRKNVKRLWVGHHTADEYVRFTIILRDACSEDVAFRRCVEDALK